MPKIKRLAEAGTLYRRLQDHNEKKRRIESDLYIWEGPDLIYVNSPKAGCTSTKFSLNSALSARTGKAYAPAKAKEIHDRSIGHLMHPFDVSETTMTRLLTSEHSVRFTFVRDPLSRLISAVADKLANFENPKPLRARLLEHLGLPNTHIFQTEEVAEIFLSDKAAFHLDRHWAPQHIGLAYGVMPYTVIGRTERFDQDFDKIITQIFGAPIPRLDTRTIYGHQTPKAHHKAETTPQLIRLVEELYAEDYAMLEDIERQGLYPS